MIPIIRNPVDHRQIVPARVKSACAIEMDPYCRLRGSLRLLLLDDERDNLDSIRELSETVDLFSVGAVQDQTGALAVLGRTCFHACLMDLGVRDKCGDEFYLLRHHGGKLPVIVLTGYPRMGKATVCMRVGACAVLSKPLDLGPGGLYRELRPALFMGILRRRGNCRGTHPRLWSAVLSFAEHRPASVREWAYRAHTDERQLTRILETGIAGTPLENLKLLRFFDHVLDLSFLRSVFHLTPRDTGPVTNSGLCRGFRRYYDARTALIESVIQQADAKSASKSDNVSGTQGLVWID